MDYITLKEESMIRPPRRINYHYSSSVFAAP